jgi:UDP-GlcNAc:undecaprenyl-phosphate GlcNAc-1-phosphate transferase
VGIFLGWVAGVAFAVIAFSPAQEASALDPGGPTINVATMLVILLAGSVIMALGLLDDLRVLAPRIKLIVSVAVAGLLLAAGLGDDLIVNVTNQVGVTFEWPGERWLVLTYSVPLTVLIIVGASNATNLIDGLDGLCSGVLAIISIGFLILALHLHAHRVSEVWNSLDGVRVVLSMALVGASLGFLPMNRNPAKIFMGDAGSMLLGLNAAVILLLFSEEHRVRWMLASVIIFGLPVADMLLALGRRWRAQRPVMIGDRSHFYDQLIDRGLSVRSVVRISYLLSALFVAMGLLLTFMRMRHCVLVYGAFSFVMLFLIHRLGMLRVDRKPGRDPAGSHA